jgi:hypothetical protein
MSDDGDAATDGVPGHPTSSDGRPVRPCPFCAELILEAARICRFCQRDVSQLALLGNRALPTVTPSVAHDADASRERQGAALRSVQRSAIWSAGLVTLLVLSIVGVVLLGLMHERGGAADTVTPPANDPEAAAAPAPARDRPSTLSVDTLAVEAEARRARAVSSPDDPCHGLMAMVLRTPAGEPSHRTRSSLADGTQSETWFWRGESRTLIVTFTWGPAISGCDMSHSATE